MTTARLVAGWAVVVAATVLLAWALAQPALPLTSAAVRAVADGAAVTVLGLAAVALLDEQRHRDELIRRASGPLVVAAAGWLVAELVRLTLGAAEAAGVPLTALTTHTAWDFATITAAGRSGMFSLVAAAVICASAMLMRPTSPLRLAVAGVAGTGIAARAVAGHLAEGTLSAVAVMVHALAAAWWCGVLAALVLTVSGRGQWARVLPRFSRSSLVCVGVLLVGGTASAVARLAAPADLVATGYGRILLVKIAVTALLLALAWRNRAGWVPAASAHRVSAQTSRAKSVTELSIMAVALTLAAALTVTG
ncbi:CopD family protein [Mycolicibacterium mengxianglii]|uniref:CopD family protein n=1 Tax=Mycolicibacterium mengxianglii TaxID=2736649 RepID=UPI0018D11AEE|nr:CopD family protein [Mycolicibacterium mengxianglii]